MLQEKNIFFLRKKSLKEILILTIISLHIFFWDIKFLYQYGFREFISLLIVFIFYDLYKNKFSNSLKNKKQLIIIFLSLLFLALHLIFNILIDKGIFFKENILGLLGVCLLSIIIFFYYNLIAKNLDYIISFFLLIFFLTFIISEYDFLSEWEKNYSGICYGKFKIKHFMFTESSHLGMMLGAIFGYFIISFKNKSVIYIWLAHLIIIFILLIFPSITVFFSIFSAYILLLFYDYKFFLKKLLINIGIIILVFSTLNLTSNCSKKLSETSMAINLLNTELSKKLYSSKSTQPEVKLNEVKEKKLEKKKFLIDERVDKNFKYLGPTQKSKKLFNLTTSVFVNSINISIETLRYRSMGWGLNRYESAFDYYMYNNLVTPYWYNEVYTLNFNDGSANLSKLLTEFGYIAFLICPLLIFFFLTSKTTTNIKIFFLLIVGVQLLRGAGYFNGGFMFSLIFMIFTVFQCYRKKND